MPNAPRGFTSPPVEPVSRLEIDSGPSSTATSGLCSLDPAPWPGFEGTPPGPFEGNGLWDGSRATAGVLERKLPHRYDGIGRPDGTHGWQGGICRRSEGVGLSRNERFGESRPGSAAPARTLGSPGLLPVARSTSRWSRVHCVAAAWRPPRGARDTRGRHSSEGSRASAAILGAPCVCSGPYCDGSLGIVIPLSGAAAHATSPGSLTDRRSCRRPSCRSCVTMKAAPRSCPVATTSASGSVSRLEARSSPAASAISASTDSTR